MERYIYAVYCDDIRHEVGNKQSYIGVYSGVLIVPSFPVTLPKLCIAITAITPANKPFGKLVFRVMREDIVIIESVIPGEGLATQETIIEGIKNHEMDVRNSEPDLEKIIKASLHFVLSPFVIDSPCVLKIRVETESEVLKGSGLRIEAAQVENN